MAVEVIELGKRRRRSRTIKQVATPKHVRASDPSVIAWLNAAYYIYGPEDRAQLLNYLSQRKVPEDYIATL